MFAAIEAPDFALQAMLRHAPELRGKPVALIPDRTANARIVQCTKQALSAGVVVGMTPNQGLARCGTMIVRTRKDDAVSSARAAMLDCAGAFSPFYEDTAEGVCTLEWKGSRLPLVDEIAPTILTRMESLHLAARVGFAPRPGLALLATQSTQKWVAVSDARELADLPVDSLSPSEPVLDLLARWGVRTIGAFAALGREQLVARLGTEASVLFDRATGAVSRPLRCVPPVESYEETVEFENEIETLEPLLFMLRRLLEQIALRLELAYLVAAEVMLRLGFTQGAGYERAFKVPAPTADVDVLFRMLHTHLEQFSAEHPIVRLQLAATPCRPARQQFGLFDSALRDPNQFYETLARLVALLGSDRVGMPACEPTKRPDAFRMEAVAFDAEKKSPEQRGWELTLTLRRYRPPLPANVRFEGRPCSVASAPLRGDVLGAEGPFYASGDWWDTESWDRAEWDVQLTDGSLCRIFRQEAAWFLEGIYD